jgi:hypothetical protein
MPAMTKVANVHLKLMNLGKTVGGATFLDLVIFINDTTMF